MKLLLAEDDVMLGSSMEKGLDLAGFQVDWAKTGDQVVDALGRRSYDVVLLDIGLPQLDGLQILRWMRKEGQTTPVMLVTARDAVPDRVAGLNQGADDYLTKPFDLDELCARIHALARRQGGRSAYMNQSSFLPLKLNMSGVIPPIFASSIVMFPATASQWFGQGASGSSLQTTLQKVSQALSPGEPLHMILYAGLIIGFAFFYTALVFNSQETADNLKKSGALIPGIRPGKATADYIDGVLTRLTAAGAIYLVLVCLLPEIMRTKLGTSFYFGGTSLLIVVVVVMDFIAQIQAHLMSHQYESLLKKANLKGRGGAR